MPEIVINLQELSCVCRPPGGGYTRTKSAIVQAQGAAYGATPSWMPIAGAQITLEGMTEPCGVEVALSGIVGRSADGLVLFGIFRDGQLLEQVGAVSIPTNAAVVPIYLRWRDTTPLSGAHTYEFRWRIWSGSVYLGSRGDMNFVTNVPAVMTLDEFII
ncbi:hypothetical protein [Achromobacter xylosoxidans]|uniref:hypothetical protein n=1 Tax=Alcaligenes xylosoxydans xylosoxydans TaxID=85698 RepID=UPI00105FB0C6|nr:hypothetical protein [Achromobacter xylosoxidans]